jgi:hypothetical protein
MSHETQQNVPSNSHEDQKINYPLFEFSYEDISTCRSGLLQEILRINEKRHSQLASVKSSPLTVSYIINEFKLINNLSLTTGLLEDERKLIEEYKSILVSIINAKL